MNFSSLTRLALSAVALTAIAACSTSGSSPEMAEASQAFEINDVSISSMTTANLCRDLGGQGAAPTVTVTHTAVAGVPIRLALTDRLSDGSTFNHRSTRVSSDASGTTVVNYSFLPPCNTTDGRLDSDYRLTVQAGDEGKTISWAKFNSGTRTIN